MGGWSVHLLSIGDEGPLADYRHASSSGSLYELLKRRRQKGGIDFALIDASAGSTDLNTFAVEWCDLAMILCAGTGETIDDFDGMPDIPNHRQEARIRIAAPNEANGERVNVGTGRNSPRSYETGYQFLRFLMANTRTDIFQNTGADEFQDASNGESA
ncbi:MAG: hypothetical protein R8G34_00965 [Paracoccaceae bacterium]|nr:hypothetical protein [Paracoccaceae bacterium]